MATYKKPSKHVAGSTLMGTSFIGETDVYEAIEAHKTAKIIGEAQTTLIPFHAVKIYSSIVALEQKTKADAYCE